MAAQDDRQMAAAMAFIRNNAQRAIGVSHVVRQTYLSRRTLERRFQDAVGRSVFEEICFGFYRELRTEVLRSRF